MSRKQIPKKLHLIWVGKEQEKPVACIRSWKDNHPTWEFKLWGRKELHSEDWLNKDHISALAKRNNWSAVAALIRYEILHREGGVFADSKFYSIRPLGDWLLENELFLCWRDTLSRSALVNDAFIGSISGNPFLDFIIGRINSQKRISLLWSWSNIYSRTFGVFFPFGPYQLTQCIRKYNKGGYHNATILPSHTFCHPGDGSEAGLLAFAGRQPSLRFDAHSRRDDLPIGYAGKSGKRSSASLSLPRIGGARAIDFLHDGSDYCGEALRAAPIGGIESSVAELAEALAKNGHRVSVFNGITVPREEYGVSWRPFSEAPHGISGDIGIAVANPSFFRGLNFRQRIFWLHNAVKSWRWIRRGEIFSLFKQQPLFVLLGEYHSQHVPRWFPSNGRRILYHGISEAFFRRTPATSAPPARAIFTSQPYRGLDWLLGLWQEVRLQVPGAVLDVFAPKPHQAEANAERAVPLGVNFRGSVCRRDLHCEISKARVQLIPGHQAETFCLAAAEAIASGVPIVTRGIGALAERVEDKRTGFIAPDRDQFIGRVVELLLDDGLWLRMHRSCIETATLKTWDQRAEEWERLFESSSVVK